MPSITSIESSRGEEFMLRQKEMSKHKWIRLIPIFLILLHCSPQQDTVEKIMEDGVEVVINHREPYNIKGEPTSLILEEKWVIDLEDSYFAEMGLGETELFDIDSQGNIYLLSDQNNENRIVKFDGQGKFLDAFCRRGQGPEEIQFVMWGGIDSKDHIVISDQVSKKGFVFDNNGNFLRETRNPKGEFAIYPLENGNFISLWQFRGELDPDAEYFPQGFSLYSPDLEEIKVLDIFKYPSSLKKGMSGTYVNSLFIWRKEGNLVYIGNEDRGYEFLVYDLDGNLLRKIRKEYDPVLFPESLRKERQARYESVGWKVFFEKYWPPYLSFIVDDEGRIYARTYEEGKAPGEFMYDIFNPEGIFILKKSMNIYTWGEIDLSAVVKKGHLYCLQEKESGFKKLVIYQMNWSDE
jgi:hypothetical protein